MLVMFNVDLLYIIVMLMLVWKAAELILTCVHNYCN